MSQHSVDKEYLNLILRDVPCGYWDDKLKRVLSNFRHLNTKDNENICHIKSKAAFKASIAMKKELSQQRLRYEKQQIVFPVSVQDESANKFINAIRYCPQLTHHLLAHKWPNGIATWFCPLSPKMSFWRKNNGLSFIDKDNQDARVGLYTICPEKNLRCGENCQYHLEFGGALNCPYHIAVRIYMQYCSQHFPDHICFTVNYDQTSSSRSLPVKSVYPYELTANRDSFSTTNIDNGLNSEPPPYTRNSDKVLAKPKKKCKTSFTSSCTKSSSKSVNLQVKNSCPDSSSTQIEIIIPKEKPTLEERCEAIRQRDKFKIRPKRPGPKSWAQLVKEERIAKGYKYDGDTLIGRPGDSDTDEGDDPDDSDDSDGDSIVKKNSTNADIADIDNLFGGDSPIEVIDIDNNSQPDNDDSLSGHTTLSTQGSLKRKSSCSSRNCDTKEDKEPPMRKIPVTKQDYALLFPISCSLKKFSVQYLDCGPDYGILPCRKWEGDSRFDSELIKQGRKDAKYRDKQAKKYGSLDYQHKNRDKKMDQIKFANILEQVKKDCLLHSSSVNASGVQRRTVIVDINAQEVIHKSEKILMIGMAYWRDIVKQFKKDHSKLNLTECVGKNNKKIDISVARDTFRCMKIEDDYQSTRVYNMNSLRDKIGSTIDDYNINLDVNDELMIRYLKRKKLYFNEIYLDHFRMPTHHVEIISDGFLSNIVDMVKMGALRHLDKGNPAVVYLPFSPSMFHMVYAFHDLKSYFVIHPVFEKELKRSNHKLYYVTEKNQHEPEINYATNDQNKFITCTREDILNYPPRLSIFDKDANRILDDFVKRGKEYYDSGAIENVRYLKMQLGDMSHLKGVSN